MVSYRYFLYDTDTLSATIFEYFLFSGLVLKAFKLNANDDEHDQVNAELTEITPAVKELVHVAPSK